MTKFPHVSYVKHVLLPAYQDAVAYLYEPMLAANRAQAVMLAHQSIISRENARALLDAIAQVEAEGLEALTYQPGIEDLFFRVEGRIIELAGPEFGGNLQLARSRNDLGHALARLSHRPPLLQLYQHLLRLREALVALARRHLETVMPGYTHTQPAQPVTFAHYLAGVLSFLERDTGRLQHAYHINNQSPLGAAAFTGTGFPIDRHLSADLLGFADVIPSSQDSIGASDHLTDIASALTSLAVNLSRITKDLLFLATRESGAIRIDDSFIQISSIMPQKRNPVVLEHLRARLSRLLGQAQTIITQCHNIPYGDTQDIEDEIEPTVIKAIQTANSIVDLYTSVLETIQLNEDHLRKQAAEGFTTVTELADVLVRESGLPFRTAHQLVSRIVNRMLEQKLSFSELTPDLLAEASKEVLPDPLYLDQDSLRRALDPMAFVEVRTTFGGVAPAATRSVLLGQADRLKVDSTWLLDEQSRLINAENRLRTEVENLLAV